MGDLKRLAFSGLMLLITGVFLISCGSFGCCGAGEKKQLADLAEAVRQATAAAIQAKAANESAQKAAGRAQASITPPFQALVVPGKSTSQIHPSVPSGSLPAPYTPTDPNGVSDISCRPKLTATPNTVVKLASKNGDLVKPEIGAWKEDSSGGLTWESRVGVLSALGPDETPILGDKAGVPQLGPDGKPVGTVVLGPLSTVEIGADRNPIKVDGKYRLGTVGMLMLGYDGQPIHDNTHAPVVPYGPSLPGYGDSIVGKPVLGEDGQPLPPIFAVAKKIPDHDYCQPLLPVTRLILENAAISSTFQHSNQAGLTNVAATSPANTALIQSSDSYSVGVGYVNKPILKQARAVIENDKDGRRDVSRQGTFWEDFFWNAILANASLSYGRTITVKNGQLTDSLVTRPSFSAGVTYQLDLERAYVHLFHTDFFQLDNRPVDTGYYYQPNPNDKNFWPEPPKYNDGE